MQRRPLILMTLILLWGCSPERAEGKADVPDGTPTCEDTCNTAWPCGGVLENDLQTCLGVCSDDDDRHGDYRVCIAEMVCEDMPDCKVYGPTGNPPAE